MSHFKILVLLLLPSCPLLPPHGPPAAAAEATPTALPGAESFLYREGPAAMRLFVVKPKDWKAGDQRPALVFYFGGGWTTGTPASSIFWAKFAAELGLVGVAPDYRT